MSDLSLNGLFQILTEVIRAGENLPFTCYISLAQNKKVIPFLIKNEVVPEDRLKKLDSFGFAHLYVKYPDKEAYYKYLQQQLDGPNGKALKALIQHKISEGNLVGIPTNESGELMISSNSENTLHSSTTEVAASSQETSTTELTGVSNEVMVQLKSQIHELEQKLKLRSLDDKDLKQWACGAVSLIDNEVQRIGAADTPTGDEAIKAAASLKEKLQSQIAIVMGKYGDNSEVAKTISNAVAPYYEAYSKYVQNGWPQTKEEQDKALKQLQNASSQALSSIRILSGAVDKDVFEDSLEHIFRSVEDGLSVPLDLNPSRLARANHKHFMKIWVALVDIKEILSLNPANVPRALEKLETVIIQLKKLSEGNEEDQGNHQNGSSPTSESKDDRPAVSNHERTLDVIKGLAKTQNTILDRITDGLKNLKLESRGILESWISFQALAKRKLDVQDVMKSGQIFKMFQDFEYRLFSELNSQRKELKAATSEIYNQLGEDGKSILDSFEFEVNKTVSDDSTTEGKEDITETPAMELERLRSENNLLNLQIENAQQLAATTVKKNDELEELLRQSGTYGESLEQEIEQLKKRLNKALEETTENEGERRRLIEGLEDTNDKQYRTIVDAQTLREKLAEKEDRIKHLEQAKGIFTDSTGVISTEVSDSKVVSLFRQKDEQYKNLEKKLESLQVLVDNLKKDNNTYQAKMVGLEAERKDLGKRIDKALIEKDNARRGEKNLDLKITMTNTLLTQARKTIDKLTRESEELRQDRLKYISKTKDIISEQKAIAGQAVTLSSQLQAESQKVRQLTDQLESLKRREAEDQKNQQNIQKGIELLLVENKKLKAAAAAQSESGSQSNVDSLKGKIVDLEKKIENLKQEIKETSLRFVQEQKKAQTLEQEIRTLKNRAKQSA